MSDTPEYSQDERKALLDAAKQSIQYGLDHGRPLAVELENYDTHLQQQRASFVTLEINHRLRGCIGSLLAHRPVIEDVSQNAFNAAFSDPRFPGLTMQEFTKVAIHISILTTPEEMSFVSEQDLIRQLSPGIDGLILSDKGQRGTFLPSVWEQLPEPENFLKHLKNKAGLPMTYWSDSLKVQRYRAEIIQ